MLKKWILIAAVLVCAPHVVWASFTGNWSGGGDVHWGPGNNGNCRSVNFRFDQGFTTFNIQRGQAICDNATINFPTGTLTIENGVLKDRGFAIGMIGADYFHFCYSFRPGTLNIVDARMNSKGVLSIVHTEADNLRGTTEIRATLNAVGN